MKNYYLIILSFFSIFSTKAQNECEDANAYLVNAYSHVKDAYNSNNISHLKHYAKRAVESFKLAKGNFESCDCKTALNFVHKGIDLLAKVEYAKTFEDGRFFVKRGRDIAKESVIESDKCNHTKEYVAKIDDTKELKPGKSTTKNKLITSYNTVISSNIKSYNAALKACNCSNKAIKAISTTKDLLKMSIEDIQKELAINLKELANNYLFELEDCK